MGISDWSSDVCASDLAAARVLLCKAAAARWDVAWESCDIRDGIVSDGGKRTLELGEVVEDAATFDLPDILPFRQAEVDRLAGQDLPRLDTPSKIDGSHNFAADLRLPEDRKHTRLNS